MSHITLFFLVGIEDDVGVSIVELAIVVLGPVGDLQQITLLQRVQQTHAGTQQDVEVLWVVNKFARAVLQR